MTAEQTDLSTRSDVHDVVVAFYREVVFDDLLEPVFAEVAEVDWAEHIPKLIDYWCWILFRVEEFDGAVTAAHRQLQGLMPLRPEHCDRWFSLWARSVDERAAGPRAERAKDHAAALMAGMARHIFGFAWAAPDANGGRVAARSGRGARAASSIAASPGGAPLKLPTAPRVGDR